MVIKRIYLVKDTRSEDLTQQVSYDEYKGHTIVRRKKEDRYVKRIKLYDGATNKYRRQTVDVQVMNVTKNTVMIGVI